jgi:hypothetical protein
MKKKLTQKEAINSSAYRMLNSMIQDKTEELLDWMSSIKNCYERASNPSYYSKDIITGENTQTFYKAKLRTGVSFDAPPPKNGIFYDEGENDKPEIEIPLELNELKRMRDTIDFAIKLEEQIHELNREKLYLIQADYDWRDNGRRSERVFGVKEID